MVSQKSGAIEELGYLAYLMCGFADLLNFATVDHTTKLFHHHVNIALTFYYGRAKSLAP
jgi:hypothetical protein